MSITKDIRCSAVFQ